MNPGVAAFRPGEVFQLVDESIVYLGQESPTFNLARTASDTGRAGPLHAAERCSSRVGNGTAAGMRPARERADAVSATGWANADGV